MQATDKGELSRTRGRLKIGDDWNAITIIALSQSSPLKAIAELVENSIDAKARTVRSHAAASTGSTSSPFATTAKGYHVTPKASRISAMSPPTSATR